MTDMVPVITKEVTIDGEKYSMDVVPKATSLLVKKEKEQLTTSVDLPALVGDLRKLNNFVKVAYYGVAGCTELQIAVQNIGFTVGKLCQESDVTVVMFRKACNTVTETLQSTYLYLLDGFEDVAVDNLKGLAEIAQKMADASDNLTKEFQKAEAMVKKTLEETRREKGRKEDHKKNLETERGKEEIEKVKAEQRKEAAAEQRKERSVMHDQAERKEQAAHAEAKEKLEEKSSFFRGMVNVIKTVAHKAVLSDYKDSLGDEIEYAKQTAKDARDEKLKHLEEMKELRQAQMEATLQLRESVLKIQQSEASEELTDSTIGALHGAQGALSALTVIMMQASKFWRLMHEHCKDMASTKMVDMIEKMLDKPEARRQKMWTSDSFKRQAVLYYTKWVALEDVCGIYQAEIRDTEKQILLFMQENPTTEDARKALPSLTQSLNADLDAALATLEKKAIKDKDEHAKLTQEKKDDA